MSEERIDRLPASQDGEVEMRAGRDAGEPHEADDLIRRDRVADSDSGSRERVIEMRVDRDEATGMRDEDDHRAVGQMTDERDPSIRGRDHGLSESRREVDRVVEVRVVHALVAPRRL